MLGNKILKKIVFMKERDGGRELMFAKDLMICYPALSLICYPKLILNCKD